MKELIEKLSNIGHKAEVDENGAPIGKCPNEDARILVITKAGDVYEGSLFRDYNEISDGVYGDIYTVNDAAWCVNRFKDVAWKDVDFWLKIGESGDSDYQWE